jgi:hypothetical protein
MLSPPKGSRMVRPASTYESLVLDRSHVCYARAYNKSERNVREVELLCQIASSVSTWHHTMGVLSTTK